jgi:pimeloyl-ACP methyl ester carboxylesterase
LLGIGGLVLVAGVILLGGAVVHVYQVQKLARQFPAPGRLYDVGGRMMHMMVEGENCVAENGRTPTVIFIGGGYSQGLTMHHLYKMLAQDTRAIIFDRAGTGWSDRSPEPRHVRNDVEDLKRLLDAAGEDGPYILSGHSWGGLFANNFAWIYPEDTAGVVLLDATPPGSILGDGAAGLEWFGRFLKTSAVLNLFSLVGLMPSLGGEGQMDPESPEFLYEPIKDVWELAAAAEIRSKSGLAAGQSFFDMLAAPENQPKDAGDLGDIPLFVLYRENTNSEQEQMTEEERRKAKELGMKMMKMTEEEYDRMLEDSERQVAEMIANVVKLSSRGVMIHPPEPSTHQFPYEQPEFCADKVREMIALVLAGEAADTNETPIEEDATNVE